MGRLKAFPTLILHALFILSVMLWFWINFSGQIDSPLNYHFNLFYAIISVYGGILCLFRAREWGLLQSLNGRAIFGIGLALIFFGIGGLTWSYYNYGGFTLNHIFSPQTIESEPYPGWPDVGFVLFTLFCFWGLFNLIQAVGFKYLWRAKNGKIYLILMPVLTTIITFIIFQNGRLLIADDKSALLEVMLNYFYTISDALLITVSLNLFFLSTHFRGGKLKGALALILLALIIQYFADLYFSIRITNKQYFNADYSDLLFAVAVYTLAAGGSLFSVKGES